MERVVLGGEANGRPPTTGRRVQEVAGTLQREVTGARRGSPLCAGAAGKHACLSHGPESLRGAVTIRRSVPAAPKVQGFVVRGATRAAPGIAPHVVVVVRRYVPRCW